MSLSDFVRRLFGAPAPASRLATSDAPSTDEAVTRWQKALRDFGYPHKIVSPRQVHEALRTEEEIGAREGFTPVIIVPGLWSSERVAPEKRTKQALGLLGGKCDASFGREFLARKFAALYDDFELDPEGLDPALFDTLRPVSPVAVEPGLWLLRRYNRETRSMEDLPQVSIMRIPTTESHTIPVHLDWGGWNAAPTPLEIVAVSRYWGESYGARLTAIGSAQLEFTVTRKPAGHAEAVTLLKEQYCFAPDNWQNDRNMLEEAAAELLVSDTWFFWWD